MKELARLFMVFNATFTMNAQILEGSHWTARKVDDVYIVSVQDKSSISEALIDFAVSQKIQGGEVTGIGAVNEATLRFFDPATKKYDDKVFKDRKSTRLNSSHSQISYAVFCLKKKKTHRA